MLDLFTVITKGGLVLWQKRFTPSDGSPIDSLIREVLIEERAAHQPYIKDSYALKWTFANELDLVFIVVYQKILQLTYVDELLETTKRHFCNEYGSTIKSLESIPEVQFDKDFDSLLLVLEDKADNERRTRGPKKFEDTRKFQNSLEGLKKEPVSQSNTFDENQIAQTIENLKLRGVSPRMGGRGGKKGGKSSKATSPEGSPSLADDPTLGKKKVGKQARVWDGQISRGEMESLDYSAKKEDEDSSVAAERLVDRSNMGHNVNGYYEVQDLADETEEDYYDEKEGKPLSRSSKHVPTTSSGGLFGYFKNLTGQKDLTQKDLEPILAAMKEHLINKNVAADIAATLCDSVGKSLVGKRTSGYRGVEKIVKETMEVSLKRILTPKTSVDLLRDIQSIRAQKRPYSIAFIGVNGVGKSTNLSKVCFWLLQNNLRVLIAACDTFRSGAVEQLRVHARNLKGLSGAGEVELFERGYGKDSAGIAKDAIQYAKSQKFDVVLIDTAGRMQDNEPLMRALAKLVAVNNPDKIIFVGEALVGNEAVDQLTKFNQALKDFSGMAQPRVIDGMILTKFDTIDDKVGAALSMTYTTGQPIFFVGTGQTYTDLKNMKVSNIVASLLKN